MALMHACVKALNETGAPGWNVAHTSDGFGCHASFCYSSEDLCTHHESDHNLYGVCKVSQQVYRVRHLPGYLFSVGDCFRHLLATENCTGTALGL